MATAQMRTKRRTALTKLIRILKFIAAQWLVIGFGLAALFGYLFPHIAAHGGVIKSEYSILYGAVAIIFLVSGLQLSHAKLRKNATNWRLHIITQGISYLVIPAIQLIIVHISIAAGALHSGTPDVSVLVGMIVLGCLPTTIASNVVMTRASGGDEAAAIVEVVIGNAAGSFVSPGLIYALIPKRVEFDAWQPASPSSLGAMYASTMKLLGLSVLLPLAAGQLLRWLWERQVDWVLRTFWLPKVSTACLILLIWTTFSGSFETGALYELPTPSLVFNIVMNVASYFFFTLICFYVARPPVAFTQAINSRIASSRLFAPLPNLLRRVSTVRRMSREQTVAICFCGAAKTTSLGIPLVTAMWAQRGVVTVSYVQIPVLLYTIEQVFMAQILVYFFKWYLARGESEVLENPGEATASRTEGEEDSDRRVGNEGQEGREVLQERETCVESELVAKGEAPNIAKVDR